MRQVTKYPLWLGHVGDLRDLRAVVSAEILAVVDLAANHQPANLTRELVYCRFPLLDGAGNPPWLLRVAVSTVAWLLRSGTPTLVVCSAGMSRTPIIAAAAIAQLRGCSLGEAVAFITPSGPADISPALLAEVQAVLAEPVA